MNQLRILFFALIGLLINSCNKSQPLLHSGVILNNMDTLVSPGDNFHLYVNGGWIKKQEIPADKATYGITEILDDQANENVKIIIEEAAKGNFKTGSNEQKIGDFFNAYVNFTERNATGINPLIPVFKQIDGLSDGNNLSAYFGEAARLGKMVPLTIGVIEDFKDPTRYMLYTWQAGIGLPEREYYFLNDAKSKEIRAKYVAHISKMLTLCNLPEAAASAGAIMALETELANVHVKKEDTRDVVKLYNKYAVADLSKLSSGINWKLMLERAGVKNVDSIVVTQVSYVKSLDNILKKTPLQVWKNYLKWSAIQHAASYLNSALDKQNFEFYGKVLAGTKIQQPLWKRGVQEINNSLGEAVGEVYVKKHFSAEAKQRMTTLVNNLLLAYRESINSLDWMTPTTKKEALKKLNKFTAKIGYPDKWRDYSKLKITKGDLYGNVTRSIAFEYYRQISKLGQPVDRSEWGMTPQTVNAYYNPTLNEIVFPAAILQPPFFDLKAEDAINYGGIGAVIGHEIGHGFDDQGSTFDGDGVMSDWWTSADKAAFKKRTQALVSQFNTYKVFPDLAVNGEFTLGENIGDLGGLSIALKAYQMSLKGKPAPVMNGFSGIQRVFIGWAQSWLSKEREEYLRNQVASDPHSPAIFRVNGIVRNIPEFYTAFKVKPSDSLYLAPEKRVKIW